MFYVLSPHEATWPKTFETAMQVRLSLWFFTWTKLCNTSSNQAILSVNQYLPQFLTHLTHMRGNRNDMSIGKSQHNITISEPFVLQQRTVSGLKTQFRGGFRIGQMVQIERPFAQDHANLKRQC